MMTERQQVANDALEQLGIYDTLCLYNPILAGTIPIDIDVPDSDLDIICEVSDFGRFEQDVREAYEQFEEFAVHRRPEKQAIVIRFVYEGFMIEIFGKDQPSKQQNAYRHMIIEGRLLKIGGDEAKDAIRELKLKGLKTEPAFAEFFDLSGNPYEMLLELADLTDDELREKLNLGAHSANANR